MDEKIEIIVEQFITSLSNAQIVWDEENFYFVLISGNSGKRYSLSPKHAKRFSLLLQRQLKDYEAKFSHIDTVLPSAENKTQEKAELGFRPDRKIK